MGRVWRCAQFWPNHLRGRVVLISLLCIHVALNSANAQTQPAALSIANIPRVDEPPRLEDFLEMTPLTRYAGKLAKLNGNFIQREPSDGQPSQQRTDVYMGYDDKSLYFVFLAFDDAPTKIWSPMVRRDDIVSGANDLVGVALDTYGDRRRALVFESNPDGVQMDAVWTEGRGMDLSFDTLWYSRGRRTDHGYMVLITIPLKSLRFSSAPIQTWGVYFVRFTARLNELSFWPHLSLRVEGRLNQAGTLRGLERISPGRNMQFIPYGVFRSFRALDQRDPLRPVFQSKTADGSVGLDAKFVLRDTLALDLTANPDFSQVESDEPQNTVNQRFEVFFPEKRPFFLENAGFFESPINLLFTRRITDPQFGSRLTGKAGPYAIGLLFSDDQSPGRIVPPGYSLEDERARFAVARVNRDILKNSTVGVIYSERRLLNSWNYAGGVDFRLKLGDNWVTRGQAVASATRFLDGSRLAGPAYEIFSGYTGRTLSFDSTYADTSPGFLTQTGFFRRPDIRRITNNLHYRWRPEGKNLISHGPSVTITNTWDHTSTYLDELYGLEYVIGLRQQTEFAVLGNFGHETLRPADFPSLAASQEYVVGHRGFRFFTSFLRQFQADGNIRWGRGINFEPRLGPPVSARSNIVEGGITLRPMSPLTIENRYIHSRLRTIASNQAIFNSHVIRSKWNYQITRELAVRFITQYNALLANEQFSSLSNTKNLNFDFLVTYLLHPGTAVHVGYNSNLQNIDPSLQVVASGLLRSPNRLINDGRQVFVKVSYLIRR